MAQAILASWSVAPGLTTVLVLLAALYARGWHVLRRQMPERFPVWRLARLLGGLATLHLALASPIDALAGPSPPAHSARPSPSQVVPPALPAARGPRHSAASRPAATLRQERARSVPRLAGAAAIRGRPPASGHVLVRVRGGHVAVASARALPA